MRRPGFSFHGQTVLVTGASSGIGRETALAFAGAGANLVVAARRTKSLAAVAAAARKLGAQALAVTTDVTQRQTVAACFDKAVERFGSVDVVINNAGVLKPSTVETIRDADLRAMMDVNLFGALHVMQEAVRVMRASGRGRIVNLASLAGRRGMSPLGGYCATKFALIGLTEALRMELDGTDIGVSLVLPGVVDTPMAAHVRQDPELGKIWPESLNMPPSWVVASIFLAVRLRLTEIAVPPGAALVEKLAALAPGAADSILRAAIAAAKLAAERRGATR